MGHHLWEPLLSMRQRENTPMPVTVAYQIPTSHRNVLEDGYPQLPVSSGGAKTVSVTASGTTVVSGSSTRLCRVLVTASGTTAATVYDNATAATGTVVGVVPASTAAGTVYDLQMPCANGITVAGSAGGPTLTISFS